MLQEPETSNGKLEGFPTLSRLAIHSCLISTTLLISTMSVGLFGPFPPVLRALEMPQLGDPQITDNPNTYHMECPYVGLRVELLRI